MLMHYAHPHPPYPANNVQNSASLVLGIIALVFGSLALLVGWIPFLGLLAIPVAVLGGLLALIGLVIALVKNGRGIILPLVGGAVCGLAFFIPLLSTGAVSEGIAEAVDEVEREIEQENAEEAAYIAQHLELSDLSASYQTSVFDERVPGVLFKIRNNGDRALTKVEVTVYFKDASDTVIAEENFTPVSPFSIGPAIEVLRPDYLWEMAPGKFYAAESVPSEWKEGSIEAVISDIEFGEG